MNRTPLDTDTLSEINKAHDAALVATATAYLAEHGKFTLSAVTVMEAIRGYQQAGRAERLAQFLTSLAAHDVLAFSQSTAELAGKIDGDLLRRRTADRPSRPDDRRHGD